MMVRAGAIPLAVAVGLLTIVARAAPPPPIFFSATSSANSQRVLDTPLTSFASSSSHNAPCDHAQPAADPPVLHHGPAGEAIHDQPGLGPPEDSDSSLPPKSKAASKCQRPRKRQASSPTFDLSLIKEYNEQHTVSPVSDRPAALRSPDIQAIDPRLLDGLGSSDQNYAYEPKDGSAYTPGMRRGFVEELVASQAFSQAPEKRKRGRKERKKDFYRCTYIINDHSCGRRHDTQADLNHHMKYHGPKIHKCTAENCKAAFSVEDQLARHVRSSHAAEKAFKCHCGGSYSRSDCRPRHENTKKHRDYVATKLAQGAANIFAAS